MLPSLKVQEGQAPGRDLAGTSGPLLPQPGQMSPRTEENTGPVAPVPCSLLQRCPRVTQPPLDPKFISTNSTNLEPKGRVVRLAG